jgi:hypothetical protein
MKHTSESQNLLVGVHNRRVCGDWSTQNIVGVVQVDNDDLVLFVDFLPHTDKMVGFEGQRLSSAGVNRWLWTGVRMVWLYRPGKRWKQAARPSWRAGGAH